MAALKRGEIEEVTVSMSDGALRRHFAFPNLPEAAAQAPEPPERVRILSPFDPALRDRKRCEKLFGFHYRIEVFVPEAQRNFGYYVFPVMEGARLIGRIDLKCRRTDETLAITAFWPEPGIRMGPGRIARLAAELDRLGRFTGCTKQEFSNGWLRFRQEL